MIDMTIATITLSFYGILSIGAIVFWFMFIKRKTNNYFMIGSALFAFGVSLITVPLIYDGLLISGLGRYIISITGGVTMAFSPIIVISSIVIWIQKYRSTSIKARLRRMTEEDITKFYNYNK